MTKKNTLAERMQRVEIEPESFYTMQIVFKKPARYDYPDQGCEDEDITIEEIVGSILGNSYIVESTKPKPLLPRGKPKVESRSKED